MISNLNSLKAPPAFTAFMHRNGDWARDAFFFGAVLFLPVAIVGSTALLAMLAMVSISPTPGTIVNVVKSGELVLLVTLMPALGAVIFGAPVGAICSIVAIIMKRRGKSLSPKWLYGLSAIYIFLLNTTFIFKDKEISIESIGLVLAMTAVLAVIAIPVVAATLYVLRWLGFGDYFS